jgi:FkbM family methyltransferase
MLRKHCSHKLVRKPSLLDSVISLVSQLAQPLVRRMKTLLKASVNLLPAALRRVVKYIPVVAPAQRWLIRHYLEGHAFVHTVNAGPAAGLRFEVKLPQDKAIWTGTYEYEFLSAIVEHIRKDDVCYDIGGHRGFISGAMALAGASRVFVFEPVPANQKAIARLVELNPQLPILMLPYAISGEDSAGHFQIRPDLSMGSLADGQERGEQLAEFKTMPITVRQIDSLLQNQEIIRANVAKIDVEGAEFAVLNGALNLLREFRPKLFLEAHSAALERSCSEILLPLGYSIRRVESEIRAKDSVRHLICLPC